MQEIEVDDMDGKEQDPESNQERFTVGQRTIFPA